MDGRKEEQKQIDSAAPKNNGIVGNVFKLISSYNVHFSKFKFNT
jgi:hypothetical protein